jgi:predicted RNase H-like HicB family nuclease
MSAFTYPAKFTAGSDGRVLVEFVDLPRVSTDGKDDHEAMEEAMDALGSDLSIRLSRREEIPARLGREAWPPPGARAALARAETGALSGDARPAGQQLRTGAPPWGPRASDPPYARSRACYEGGKIQAALALWGSR